ncbi:unnamed protein product [Lampetra fluviatilis]
MPVAAQRPRLSPNDVAGALSRPSEGRPSRRVGARDASDLWSRPAWPTLYGGARAHVPRARACRVRTRRARTRRARVEAAAGGGRGCEETRGTEMEEVEEDEEAGAAAVRSGEVLTICRKNLATFSKAIGAIVPPPRGFGKNPTSNDK